LLTLVQRYPALVDGAFVIIAWVGIKLALEYLHAAWHVGIEIPQWFSLGLIGVIFTIAFVYARMQGPARPPDSLAEKAERVLATGEQDT
jgi:predicted tellurium resistance membrane protein TerC